MLHRQASGDRFTNWHRSPPAVSQPPFCERSRRKSSSSAPSSLSWAGGASRYGARPDGITPIGSQLVKLNEARQRDKGAIVCVGRWRVLSVATSRTLEVVKRGGGGDHAEVCRRRFTYIASILLFVRGYQVRLRRVQFFRANSSVRITSVPRFNFTNISSTLLSCTSIASILSELSLIYTLMYSFMRLSNTL